MNIQRGLEELDSRAARSAKCTRIDDGNEYSFVVDVNYEQDLLRSYQDAVTGSERCQWEPATREEVDAHTQWHLGHRAALVP